MRSAAGVPAPDGAVEGLHPAFRLFLLLALAAMLFRYSLAALGIAWLLLLGLAALAGREALLGIARSLRRIRWLLLSIALIYLWIAPEPTTAGAPWWPSWSDLDTALRRSGVLVVLVTAVELLRWDTSPARLAAGLVMLLAPLTRLGVDVPVFSRRLALTLDAVPLTAERVARAAAGRRPGIAGWAHAAAILVRDVEQGGDEHPDTAQLPTLAYPGRRDWGLLATGLTLCWMIGQL